MSFTRPYRAIETYCYSVVRLLLHSPDKIDKIGETINHKHPSVVHSVLYIRVVYLCMYVRNTRTHLMLISPRTHTKNILFSAVAAAAVVVIILLLWWPLLLFTWKR